MEQCASLDCQLDPRTRYSIPRAEIEKAGGMHFTDFYQQRKFAYLFSDLAVEVFLSQKDSH